MNWKNTNWLKVVAWASIFYLGTLLWILGPCDIWAISQTTKLNEFGDFLAGVFAPLALIWLVAAVLTQRQELDETRSQFAESQKVIDRQLDSIEKQNMDAEEQAVRNYKLSLFEYRFEIFKGVDEISRKITINSGENNPNTYADKLSILAHRSRFVFGDEVQTRLMEIAALYIRASDIDEKQREATAFQDFDGGNELDENIMSREKYIESVNERKEIMDKISNSLSYANRTLMFEKYLDVTDVRRDV